MLWTLNVVFSSSSWAIDVKYLLLKIPIPKALLVQGLEKLAEADLTKWFVTEKHREFLTQATEVSTKNIVEYLEIERNQLHYKNLASNERALIEGFLERAHLIKKDKIKYHLASINSEGKKVSTFGYYIRYNPDEESYSIIKVFLRSCVTKNYIGQMLDSYLGLNHRDLDEQEMEQLHNALLDTAVVNEINRQVTRSDEKIQVEYE